MPTAFEFLLLDVTDRIATVTINRADKLNALNSKVIGELDRMFTELHANAHVGAIILTGAGRAFVAGADIAEVAANASTPEGLEAVSAFGTAAFTRIERGPKPVIAAINGFALGGGCELAMACHIRIAGENAKFGQPEVKLGIAPGYGGTQRLPRLVGKGIALQLILTAEMIDAAEAYRIGLVNKVVPAGDLLAESEKMMRGILAMGPLAVRLAIEAIDQGLEMSLDEGLLLEANHVGLLAATLDMREGTTAFLEKRAAKFQGR